MIAYIIPILLIIAGLGVYDIGCRLRGRMLLYWSVCAVITLVFGLRDGIGADTLLLYMPAYAECPTFSMLSGEKVFDSVLYSSFAPGFRLFMVVFKSLGAPFWVVQLVHCAIVNTVFFLFFKRYTRYIFTAILFFAIKSIYFDAEIMRESLAISIFLISFPWLEARKWMPYLVCCVVAMMFHMSAVIMFFLPLVVIFNLRFDKRFAYVAACFVIACVLMLYALPWVSQLFGATYSEKIRFYAELLSSGTMNINYVIHNLILNLFMPLCVLLCYKTWLHRKVPFEGMMCVYVLLGLAFPFILESAARLANYMWPLFFVSVATLIGESYRSNLRDKLLSAVVGLGVAAVFLHMPLRQFRSSTNAEMYYYKSVIQKIEK